MDALGIMPSLGEAKLKDVLHYHFSSRKDVWRTPSFKFIYVYPLVTSAPPYVECLSTPLVFIANDRIEVALKTVTVDPPKVHLMGFTFNTTSNSIEFDATGTSLPAFEATYLFYDL